MAEKANVLQTTLEVPYEGEVYVFRIPTPFDHIGIGARQREILRRIEPSSGGDMTGLDAYTYNLLKALATFEKLLVKGTTATWVWTADAKGLPVVDSEKFPPETVLLVMNVVEEMERLLDIFLFGGPGNGDTAGAKTLESESDTSVQSV